MRDFSIIYLLFINRDRTYADDVYSRDPYSKQENLHEDEMAIDTIDAPWTEDTIITETVPKREATSNKRKYKKKIRGTMILLLA